MRSIFAVFTVILLMNGTLALAAPSSESNDSSSSPRRSSSSLVLEMTDDEIRVEIQDSKVVKIQVEVYDSAGALLFDSGPTAQGEVRWPMALPSGTYRFSIRGWDEQGTLITHQVSTQGTTEIVSMDFETFPVGTSFLGASIELDGPTVVDGSLTVDGNSLFEGDLEVEGDVEIVGGRPLKITDNDAGGTTIQVLANPGNTGDVLELSVPFNVTGGQFIEFETFGAGLDVVAAVNTDGTAFFGRSPIQVLPDFLPIAFGYVRANGTVASGSGNFSANLQTTDSYRIEIDGEDYQEDEYTTIVTPSGTFFQLTPGTSESGDGRLLVLFFTESGGLDQTDFQFVTYRNPN